MWNRKKRFHIIEVIYISKKKKTSSRLLKLTSISFQDISFAPLQLKVVMSGRFLRDQREDEKRFARQDITWFINYFKWYKISLKVSFYGQ